MICQLCVAKPATRHVTERSCSGRFDDAHYCEECYQARYVKPPSAGVPFPRPRLTIGHVLILVAVWVVPNAVAAWIIRSGFITGTEVQLQLQN